jgi:hypothetical protein
MSWPKQNLLMFGADTDFDFYCNGTPRLKNTTLDPCKLAPEMTSLHVAVAGAGMVATSHNHTSAYGSFLAGVAQRNICKCLRRKPISLATVILF